MTDIAQANAEAAQNSNHVRAVRSCSIWYFFAAALCIALGVAACSMDDTDSGEKLVMASICFGLGAVHFAVGWGLMKLKSWVRIPTAVISGIGLFGFPIGTVIHGYILLTVFSRKSAAVLS